MHHFQGLVAGWYWHSANDIKSEGKHQLINIRNIIHLTFQSGVWLQYDETPISWTPWWITNEPDGGNTHNCAHVNLGGDENAGKWSAYICTESYHFICERGF